MSVVIPTYNRAEILPRAIDSALAQTIENIEIIVVDDASADDTASVVDQYGDRVRYVVHETNRGGSAARNTGIRHSTGEYIAFLDSDDEWLPTKLKQQLACLDSRSEEWVAAYCGFERIRSGPAKRIRDAVTALLPATEAVGREGGEELIRDSLLLNGFSTGGTSTLLVRRDILVAMDGFDESFQRRQDWEFRNRLPRHGKLACVDESLVVKHQSSPPSAEVTERATERYLSKFADEIEALEKEGHDVVGAHMFQVARSCFNEGQFGCGVHYLRQSNVLSINDYFELGYAFLHGLTRRLGSSERRQ